MNSHAPNNSDNDWIGPSKVAAMFKAAGLPEPHPATVRRQAAAGLIPSAKTLGGLRKFRRSDIRALISNLKSAPEMHQVAV